MYYLVFLLLHGKLFQSFITLLVTSVIIIIIIVLLSHQPRGSFLALSITEEINVSVSVNDQTNDPQKMCQLDLETDQQILTPLRYLAISFNSYLATNAHAVESVVLTVC